MSTVTPHATTTGAVHEPPVASRLEDERDVSSYVSDVEELDGEEDGERSELDLAQVLVFRVGEEWYAVPLAQVREIYGECLASPLPCVPDFVLGVVSLRGEVLSVTDLGRMTRLSKRADHAKAPAVVLDNGTCATAVVVDELGDIAEISLGRVAPPLSTSDRYQTAFVHGSVDAGDRLVGLLNVDRVLEPVGGKPPRS